MGVWVWRKSCGCAVVAVARWAAATRADAWRLGLELVDATGIERGNYVDLNVEGR